MRALAATIISAIFMLPAHARAESFNGPYIGMNAGAVVGTLHHKTDPGCGPNAFVTFCDRTDASIANGPAVASSGTGNFSSPGLSGGLQGGYNWQQGNFVYGAEADFSVLDLRDSTSTTGLFPVAFLGNRYTLRQTMSADWQASVRGRVGQVVTPRLMLYATGGLTFTDMKATSRYNDNAADGVTFFGGSGYGESSGVKPGWTAGAGGEWLLGGRWSTRAEYLYTDSSKMGFDVHTSNTPAYTETIHVNAHLRTQTMRIGLNYRL